MYVPTLARFESRDPPRAVGIDLLYPAPRRNSYSYSQPPTATPIAFAVFQAAAPAKVKFNPSIKVTGKAKKTSDCGGATFAVEWELPAGVKKLGGYVIQKVDIKADVTDCCGTPVKPKVDIPKYYPAWEAWEIDPDPKVEDVLDDNFDSPDYGDKTKGTYHIIGRVGGFAGYTLPADFKQELRTPFGFLPWTKKQPMFWTEADEKIKHELKVEWNCCDKKAPTITQIPKT